VANSHAFKVTLYGRRQYVGFLRAQSFVAHGYSHRYTLGMCGRINIKSRLTVLIKEFQLTVAPDELPLWEPRYNIPPTTEIPVIRQVDNQRTLTLMRWGLIPPWTKDIKKAPLLNNARAAFQQEAAPAT
jgi:hypothetical protein